jgi:hypothetical protein
VRIRRPTLALSLSRSLYSHLALPAQLSLSLPLSTALWSGAARCAAKRADHIAIIELMVACCAVLHIHLSDLFVSPALTLMRYPISFDRYMGDPRIHSNVDSDVWAIQGFRSLFFHNYLDFILSFTDNSPMRTPVTCLYPLEALDCLLLHEERELN